MHAGTMHSIFWFWHKTGEHPMTFGDGFYRKFKCHNVIGRPERVIIL